MVVVLPLNDNAEEETWTFFCPGCGCSHFFRTNRCREEDPLWIWDKDNVLPTVFPSITVFPRDPKRCCHLSITKGIIHYHEDCHHNMRGLEVPMEEE